MATLTASPAADTTWWRSGKAIDVAILLAAAFAMRAPGFGNPALTVDEQFYLLVGDRLLHGYLPYVDIWDRKPIGLFLIYAAARSLGGDGILAYQIVATMFAFATALIITALVRFPASRWTAVGAGAVYLTWINIFEGWGGQSPIFYNLPVSAAALLTLSTFSNLRASPLLVHARGSAAMLLVGIGIQIKYTVALEGAALGLICLWCMGRSSGWHLSHIVISVALWMACALLPTLAAWLTYALMGYGHEFFYANFISIFAKQPELDEPALQRLQAILAVLSPLFCMAALAAIKAICSWHALTSSDHQTTVLGAIWLFSSLIGTMAIGNFYSHYMLPLLPPLLFLGIQQLSGRLSGMSVIMLLLALGGIWSYKSVTETEVLSDGRKIWYVVKLVSDMRGNGCVLVTGAAPSIVYHLTGSCLPTRFAFPYHLALATEADALNVDPAVEMNRAFASRPTVIVAGAAPRLANLNVLALVDDALHHHYRLVETISLSSGKIQIYIREH